MRPVYCFEFETLDLDEQRTIINFESLLTTFKARSILEAAVALAKIGSSINPNYMKDL